MTLKEKTLTGLKWSFIDNFAGQAITFSSGIFLARLLSPKEFGLMGMITVFIAISQTFVDSGFIQSLIRKQDVTHKDYSTVFFFNIAVGAFFYILLFIFSGSISVYFEEPQLKIMVKVLGVCILFNSLNVVQVSILIKRLDFKLQAKINAISGILSGLIGLTLAYLGFGVWSLIWRMVAATFLITYMHWFFNKWKPSLIFSKQSFNELFGFGSKLLLVGLIDTIYRNIYYLVIGKYFSATELGYYTRADQFKDLPSQNINNVISKVTYPVLSTLQSDLPSLKVNYQKIIRSTMLISFVLMLGMAAEIGRAHV